MGGTEAENGKRYRLGGNGVTLAEHNSSSIQL